MFDVIRLKDENNNQYDTVPRNDMLHKLEINKLNLEMNEGEIVSGAAQIFSNYQNYKRIYESKYIPNDPNVADEINRSPYILLSLTCQAKWGEDIFPVQLTLKLDYAFTTSSSGDITSFVGYRSVVFPSNGTTPILDIMTYAYITRVADGISFSLESALSTKTEFESFNIISIDAIFVPNIAVWLY